MKIVQDCKDCAIKQIERRIAVHKAFLKRENREQEEYPDYCTRPRIKGKKLNKRRRKQLQKKFPKVPECSHKTVFIAEEGSEIFFSEDIQHSKTIPPKYLCIGDFIAYDGGELGSKYYIWKL